MKRLNADLLLGLTGLIWGFGFVAQKDAFAHIGAATFVAARFFLSSLFILPFVLRENRKAASRSALLGANKIKIAMMCAAFATAVIIQQIGIQFTSATNAAFITGLYVVLVPFVSRLLYQQKIVVGVFLAGALSIVGIGLLTGADLRSLSDHFNAGDAMMLICAVGFAIQVAMMGHVMGHTKSPCTISLLQYLATGFSAFLLAVTIEDIHWADLAAAWIPIVYAGILGGGVAYTLQAVAQQHTPAADSAILTGCGESLFGAIGGALFLQEKISMLGYGGCALILISIVMVEIMPLLKPRMA